MRQNASEKPVKKPRDSRRSADLLTNMMGWVGKEELLKSQKKKVLGIDYRKE